MPRKALTVQNRIGIHARPAQHIVKIASRYKAEFYIEYEDQRINGKSIMGVLMLAAEGGSTVVLDAEGSDAEELLNELEQLFVDKFYEE